ncbi:MAG: protein kinase, partial [Marinobacter sp.]
MEIPGYRIIREIGHGGMATVYLALHESLDRQVALKVMSPALAADPSFGERFLKEARIVARLNHPGIVSIYDIGASGHYHYMAVEYLEGEDLKARIRLGMTPEEAVDILRQLAVPLGYAHKEGFVHRDIKPENVLFRKDGTPVLTDFGIAKAIGSKTVMTKTGTSIGTPHYMSPEQARGKGVDGRSDLYSLGAIFYEMLTGALPYDAEDTFAVALMHVSDPLPELPPELDRYQPLINRLMAKDPRGRFADVPVMLEAITHVQSGSVKKRPAAKTRVIKTPQPSREEKPPVSDRRLGTGVKWLGGGVLAALLLVIVLFSWQELSARFGPVFFERDTSEQAARERARNIPDKLSHVDTITNALG